MVEIKNPDLIQLFVIKKRCKRSLTRKSIVNIAMDMVMEEKRVRIGHDILIISMIILISAFLFTG